MEPKWGPPCVKCGHPSSYHGMSFCIHSSGAASKKECDCDGYEPDYVVSLQALREVLSISGGPSITQEGQK